MDTIETADEGSFRVNSGIGVGKTISNRSGARDVAAFLIMARGAAAGGDVDLEVEPIGLKYEIRISMQPVPQNTRCFLLFASR